MGCTGARAGHGGTVAGVAVLHGKLRGLSGGGGAATSAGTLLLWFSGVQDAGGIVARWEGNHSKVPSIDADVKAVLDGSSTHPSAHGFQIEVHSRIREIPWGLECYNF